MDYLFYFLYFLSLIVSVEGGIRKYQAGRVFLDRIQSGTVSILEWRASSNTKEEMKGLSSFFGWTTVAFISIFAVFSNQLDLFSRAKFSLIILWLIIFWLSFFAYNNLPRVSKEFISILLSLSLSPFLIYLIPESHSLHETPLGLFNTAFSLFGIGPYEGFQLAVASSVYLFISIIVLFGGSFFAILLIPSTVSILLGSTAKVSASFLKRKPVFLYYLAMAFYVLSTMYFVIESRLLKTS